MVDQNPDQAPARRIFGGGRGVLVMALLAVALLAGVAGNLLPPAFAQGFGMHHDWGGGFMGGTPTQAQIDNRIDRMTKHMAIELDATADQQAKIAGIAKSAVTDLRAMREKAQAARADAGRATHRSRTVSGAPFVTRVRCWWSSRTTTETMLRSWSKGSTPMLVYLASCAC